MSWLHGCEAEEGFFVYASFEEGLEISADISGFQNHFDPCKWSNFAWEKWKDNIESFRFILHCEEGWT